MSKKNLELTKQLLEQMKDDPCGIYAIYREDNQGFRYAYIGQSKHCLTRILEHINGFSQHIDCSIKKWGLYDNGEKEGYHIAIVERCYPEQLDEKETQNCLKYAYAGYQLLNKTGGKQGQGRKDLDTGDRKKPKGYRDGIQQGYKNCVRDINQLLARGLSIEVDGKITKHKENAKKKLKIMLNYSQVQ